MSPAPTPLRIVHVASGREWRGGQRQVLLLAKSYGVVQGEEIRIGLALAQEDLAQLLGASRQRVNQELKSMEREEAIRIEQGGLVVRNRDMLMRIAEAET